MKLWLHPPDFMDALEEAQALREEGTSLHLFEEVLFKRWRACSTASLSSIKKRKFGEETLWIHGRISPIQSDMTLAIGKNSDNKQELPVLAKLCSHLAL